MSHLPQLPKGHSLVRPMVDGSSPFDVASQIVAARRGWSGGMTMKEGDSSEDDGDEDEDDGDHADPDSTVKVGDRTFKVSELQTFMAREKRQGKKAGQRSLLEKLGFESAEDAEEFIRTHREAPGDGGGNGGAGGQGGNGGQDDDAARRAQERESAAEKRERKAAEKERRADLRGALVSAGVPREDLDDALVILDRDVDNEYDDDELDEAVETLKGRRPHLFGSEDGKTPTTPPARPRGGLPAGDSGRRRHQPQRVFGAGGLERAKRKGWIKD